MRLLKCRCRLQTDFLSASAIADQCCQAHLVVGRFAYLYCFLDWMDSYISRAEGATHCLPSLYSWRWLRVCVRICSHTYEIATQLRCHRCSTLEKKFVLRKWVSRPLTGGGVAPVPLPRSLSVYKKKLVQESTTHSQVCSTSRLVQVSYMILDCVSPA